MASITDYRNSHHQQIPSNGNPVYSSSPSRKKTPQLISYVYFWLLYCIHHPPLSMHQLLSVPCICKGLFVYLGRLNPASYKVGPPTSHPDCMRSTQWGVKGRALNVTIVRAAAMNSLNVWWLSFDTRYHNPIRLIIQCCSCDFIDQHLTIFMFNPANHAVIIQQLI